MIVEYIRYALPASKVAEFEGAYARASEPLRSSPHCLAYELARCTDEPTSYILRIEWDSQEGHLKGFRSSPQFRAFYQAIAPYVSEIREMRHYDVTSVVYRSAAHEHVVTQVSSSTVIEAPLDAVWGLLKNFNNVSRWHPDVLESQIENGGTGRTAGDVRAIKLRDGTPLREKLLAISDESRSYSYSVIESPIPIRDHKSIVSLSAMPDNRTAITWTAEFVADDGADAAAIAAGVKVGVIELGFDGLKAALARPA